MAVKLRDKTGKLVALDGQMVCQNCGFYRVDHGGKKHSGECLRIPRFTTTGRRQHLRWREPTMDQMAGARIY